MPNTDLIRDLKQYLLFNEPPPSPGGGRFLSKFGSDYGVLLLRMLGALLVFSYSPPQYAWSVIAFFYALVHITCSVVKRKWDSHRIYRFLDFSQMVWDLAFASVVITFHSNSSPVDIFLFVPPLIIATYFGPFRTWAIASLSTLILAFVALTAQSRAQSTSTKVTSLMIASSAMHTTLVGSLCVLLRFFRASQVFERRETEQTNRLFRTISQGTQCGITLLRLDGSIEYWNEMQAKAFAPQDAQILKEQGYPCYWIFHGESEPCEWCAMKWEPVTTITDSADYTFLRRPRKYKIDVSYLKSDEFRRNNWAISNQLVAGVDKVPRLHLYHIYFAAVSRDGLPSSDIDYVVESVTEITDTFLEMPFFRRHPTAQAELLDGPPPISIVTADFDRKILGMNDSKFKRCKGHDSKGITKEELLGLPCHEAYKRPDKNYCNDCPVMVALKTRKPAKGITNHPGHSMVTAVPLLGPRGEPRAVVEFVDDITAVFDADDMGRQLNALENEKDILNMGLDAFLLQSKGDHAFLIEINQYTQTLSFRSADMTEKYVRYDTKETPLLDTKETELVPDILQDPRFIAMLSLGAIKEWDKLHKHIGLVIRLPIKIRRMFVLIAVPQTEYPRDFDEALLYGKILAGHFAGALVRARERSALINLIEETETLLNPDQALVKIFNTTHRLLPDECSLAIYHITDLKANLIESIGPLFQQGHFDLLSTLNKHEILRHDFESLMREPKPLFFRQIALPNGSLDLWASSISNCICFVPVTYFGLHTLAIMLVFSNAKDTDSAFPGRTRQLIHFLAEFSSMIVSRCELLRHSISSYTHGLATPIKIAQGLLEKSEHHTALDISAAMSQLNTCVQNLDAAEKTWQLASGRSDILKFEFIKLDELVEGVTANHNQGNHGNPKQITAHYRASLPACQCDRGAILTSISELIKNAVKYSVPSGAPIRVHVDSLNGYIRLLVANKGRLPSDHAQRMFCSVYRGKEHRGTEYAGSGLGLWRVATLVKGHKGKIEAVETKKSPDGTNEVHIIISLPLQQ